MSLSETVLLWVWLVSGGSFHWTRWIVNTYLFLDMCPLLGTRSNLDVSIRNFHWTQAMSFCFYFCFQIEILTLPLMDFRKLLHQPWMMLPHHIHREANSCRSLGKEGQRSNQTSYWVVQVPLFCLWVYCMGSKRDVIKFIFPHYLKKVIVCSWGSGEPLIFFGCSEMEVLSRIRFLFIGID